MSTHKQPIYRAIASLVDARRRCIAANNGEWKDRHAEDIRTLCKDFLPQGSGVDTGVQLDLDESKGERLVFGTAYHHMNDGGMYDGWTEHRVIIMPSLQHDFDIRITGRDRNDIKDYLAEVIGCSMRQGVWQTHDGEWHTDAYGEPADKFAAGLGI